ncbi:hypothetical protein T484DRAFT_1832770 [Baffinella frigidus]|nr:hypothetical protein T484DRAFT_1832770 [Cryptophyta sp. CCMP2293]
MRGGKECDEITRVAAGEAARNATRSREWLLVTEPPKDPDQGFVPQPGDPVVYFHQGHLDQLMEFPETRAEQLPWEEYPDMKPVEMCEVERVTYQPVEVCEVEHVTYQVLY